MITYWQLTPNGWTCSAVGDDYYYEPDEIPKMWNYVIYIFSGGESLMVSCDAMRYYPA